MLFRNQRKLTTMVKISDELLERIYQHKHDRETHDETIYRIISELDGEKERIQGR